MLQHLGGHELRIVTVELALVVQIHIERAVREEQRCVVTLTHKDRTGRVADVLDALLVQVFGDFDQRGQRLAEEALLCHDGRVVLQQLLEGEESAQFQLQLADFAILAFDGCEMNLPVARQLAVLLTLGFEGFCEDDV